MKSSVLETKNLGGFIFPVSMFGHMTHLRPISAEAAETAMCSMLGNCGPLYNEPWYQELMSDIAGTSRVLHRFLDKCLDSLPDQAIFADQVGGWLFALRFQYRQEGGDLPLVTQRCVNALESVHAREGRSSRAYRSMTTALLLEYTESKASQCSNWRDARIDSDGKFRIIAILCDLSFLLNEAASPPNTTS